MNLFSLKIPGQVPSIIRKNNFVLPVFLFFALVFLPGCSAMSAENSAIQYAKEMVTANFTIDPGSVTAVQKVKLDQGVLVLLQYEGLRLESGAETCVFVMETQKGNLLSWESIGGSGECFKNNDSSESLPITVAGSRSSSFPGSNGYSAVYGLLRNSQITKVVATWEDGLVQTAEIQDATYIAARTGKFELAKLEAFTDQNIVLFSTK